jgi:hypothetical protein
LICAIQSEKFWRLSQSPQYPSTNCASGQNNSPGGEGQTRDIYAEVPVMNASMMLPVQAHQTPLILNKSRNSAIACNPPEQYGRPISHWSSRELADELIKQAIVESISERQVGRYLEEADLKATP